MKSRVLIHLNANFTVRNYSTAGPQPTFTLEISSPDAFCSIVFRNKTELEGVLQEMEKIKIKMQE